MAIERQLFDWVLDAFEGFAHDIDGSLHSTSHRRGLKVWYGDAKREHYEAQLIRTDDGAGLEIGFHCEYARPEENDAVLARLLAAEVEWRPDLGVEAVAGPFIGADHWRRVSEVWQAPDPDDPETAIEIAARLADYVIALEPVRRA